MKRALVFAMGIVALFLLTTSGAWAHCEIPCGIYGDEMRFQMMQEHITTIEKSMNQINDLAKKKGAPSNQLIRWVGNKEHHAQALQEIITQYFLTQRIKIDAKDYSKKLTVLHKMLVFSMKCKQTTDLKHVGKLRDLVKDFKGLYFE